MDNHRHRPSIIGRRAGSPDIDQLARGQPQGHQLTVDPPGLVLQTIAGPGMLSDGQVKPLAPSPVTLRFHDRDRVIGVSSAGLRSKGEFLRDSTGEIEWFRWGGRIARRQTASK